MVCVFVLIGLVLLENVFCMNGFIIFGEVGLSRQGSVKVEMRLRMLKDMVMMMDV